MSKPGQPINDEARFRYATGETVVEGDHVAYAECPAVVEGVFGPRTSEARDYSCWDIGGVLILEREPPKLFGRMLFTPPDGNCWGDLDFVSRAK
jgi:hypothetical protein